MRKNDAIPTDRVIIPSIRNNHLNMIVRSIEAKGAGELPPAGYAMNTVKMEESERQQ